MVSFYEDELERIIDAELMMMGIQPSELDRMSLERRWDLWELSKTKQALQNGKIPN